MTEFFINHTRKEIVLAETDAGFNITKNLRSMFSRYLWKLDDHIEFIHSDRISHLYGVKLLVEEKYTLFNGLRNVRWFLNPASEEYRSITLDDEFVGPFGV